MAIVEEVVLRADELWRWLHALEPTFAFLLALPFMVAAAGFARDAFDRYLARRKTAASN